LIHKVWCGLADHVIASASLIFIACISQKHDAIFLGDSGQLGLGATHRVKRALYDWVPVNSLQGRKVVSLGCGSRHSAVVTAVGDVYTWGRGFEGQTGHAPLNNDTSTVG